MKVLAIETSCDETAIAIVDSNKNILSNVIYSQTEIHKPYGGVVPELAARSHVEIIDDILLESLKKAKTSLDEIDAIAATAGPGLIGGLIVGLVYAKSLALALNKPFIAVNHIEAHCLTSRLTENIEFPFASLLVSGGHCQIVIIESINKFYKIGETIDDALGECFDKVSQMIKEGYPGGPSIERLALRGNENKYNFPKPLIHNKDNRYNFSFSGLKTAVKREIEKITKQEFSHSLSYLKLTEVNKYDICASFQKTVLEIIINRLDNIYSDNIFNKFNITKLNIAGGVAANKYILSNLINWGIDKNIKVTSAPINLCTDNAAMIAWLAIEKAELGLFSKLDFKAKARWEMGDANNIL